MSPYRYSNATRSFFDHVRSRNLEVDRERAKQELQVVGLRSPTTTVMDAERNRMLSAGRVVQERH